jgi:hypothetical protein
MLALRGFVIFPSQLDLAHDFETCRAYSSIYETARRFWLSRGISERLLRFGIPRATFVSPLVVRFVSKGKLDDANDWWWMFLLETEYRTWCMPQPLVWIGDRIIIVLIVSLCITRKITLSRSWISSWLYISHYFILFIFISFILVHKDLDCNAHVYERG